MIGQAAGHYRIEAKLGEGSMGAVYRAFDTHRDRSVAIKVLRADASTSPARKRRFVQEAKAASALNHPNIIDVYDIGSIGGTGFIAMEFVAGRTLDHLIDKMGLPLRDILKYPIEIADVLARAHPAGIVHRDLKSIAQNNESYMVEIKSGAIIEGVLGPQTPTTTTIRKMKSKTGGHPARPYPGNAHHESLRHARGFGKAGQCRSNGGSAQVLKTSR
jgi:serine/threonine protein kinase